jgi:TFIIF-interacting CTD phosphatase-like protein
LWLDRSHLQYKSTRPYTSGIQNSTRNGNGVVVQEEGESSNVNGPHVQVPLNDNNNNGDGVVVQEEGESSNVNTPHVPVPLNDNNKDQCSNCEAWGVLPPMAEGNPNRKTLVLDLDGTLVHSSRMPMPAGYDYSNHL